MDFTPIYGINKMSVECWYCGSKAHAMRECPLHKPSEGRKGSPFYGITLSEIEDVLQKLLKKVSFYESHITYHEHSMKERIELFKKIDTCRIPMEELLHLRQGQVADEIPPTYDGYELDTLKRSNAWYRERYNLYKINSALRIVDLVDVGLEEGFLKQEGEFGPVSDTEDEFDEDEDLSTYNL